jgi:RNA polymerase sigma-70 factor, ECF subfamily
MTTGKSKREMILAEIPHLRAFAISLTGSVDRADDLVQEAVLRAWTHFDSFRPGSNLKAWLFTILRNLFHSEYRKRRREVEDADGVYANRLSCIPEQVGNIELGEFREALTTLPNDQREALVLVGAMGLTYEQAAQICDCAIGTIKSRVNRARTRIAEVLLVEGVEDFGPDAETSAVVSRDTGT